MNDGTRTLARPCVGGREHRFVRAGWDRLNGRRDAQRRPKPVRRWVCTHCGRRTNIPPPVSGALGPTSGKPGPDTGGG